MRKIIYIICIGFLLLSLSGCNRYKTAGSGLRIYKIDTWTGKAWLLRGEKEIEVKEEHMPTLEELFPRIEKK